MPIEILAQVVAEAAIALGSEAIQNASLGDEAKRQGTWQRVAHRMGGTWLHPENAALAAFHGGIELVRGESIARIEAHIRRTGGNTGAYTVARAPYVLGAGPALSVFHDGFGASIGKLFGGEDLVIGTNAEFDDRFVVRSGGDAEGTKAALSPEVQTRMLASHDDAILSVEQQVITLAWRGFEKEAAKVESAIEVVLGVAQARAGWFDGFASARGARRIAPAGTLESRQPPSFAFDDGPISVRAFPALLNSVLGMRVHARRAKPAAASARVTIEKDGSFDHRVLPEGLVSSSVAARLAEIGGARLGVESEELWLDLPSSATVTRLETAVSLVGAMAAGVEGSAFR